MRTDFSAQNTIKLIRFLLPTLKKGQEVRYCSVVDKSKNVLKLIDYNNLNADVNKKLKKLD